MTMMMKEESKSESYVAELRNTQTLCEMLLKTPHYAKMGPEGIFAIVETAKSLGVDPRQALGGGLYFVKGKVEMSSRMMAALIRAKKHSITRDTKSNDQVCILHGKRSDTNDCWTESFSIEEAQRAGLVRAGSPWQTFPRDMLYARALSRLARQLFPDVIGNCYVEGEIALDPNIKEKPFIDTRPIEAKVLSSEQKEQILRLYEEAGPEAKRFVEWANVTSVNDITYDKFDAAIKVLTSLKKEHLQKKEKVNDIARTAIAAMA